MPYEVFESKSTRQGGPTISIRPDGVMRFNSDATAILKKMGTSRVLLLWDREKLKLAIDPAQMNDERSYKVTYSRHRAASGFAAKAFAKHIGWKGTCSVALPMRVGREHLFEVDVPAKYLKSEMLRKRVG